MQRSLGINIVSLSLSLSLSADAMIYHLSGLEDNEPSIESSLTENNRNDNKDLFQVSEVTFGNTLTNETFAIDPNPSHSKKYTPPRALRDRQDLQHLQEHKASTPSSRYWFM